ncbi:MAG TPA: Bax inhibitor-1/YccA family protein [Candidatus Aquilonibacter sp.]|nr:Bax inhibitor-1/YccA family protein [Candidatus Aquilonibacter sp.]
MPGLFKPSNPALNSRTFEQPIALGGEAMTLQGTVNKTGLLLFLAVSAAAWTWYLANTEPDSIGLWMWGGLIVGLAFALATIFKKEWSPVTAPAYAICEGLALGGISATFEQAYHGLPMQALGLTFGVTLVMLVLYTSRVLRATPKFTMGVVAATGGVFLVYMADIVLRFFGKAVPLLNSAGPWGIAISVVIVIIAALNLIVDFGVVESGVQAGAPKYMEWYGAFGIIVTLVWMYLEMLRLLAKRRQQ